ncbi:MAG: DUF2905 domain-containing protein [Synergistes sp.]|nr:DUF2905 domain-containing protein [Synergistes sp.]
MISIGKMLITFGAVLIVLGVLMLAAGKFNIPFGNLPFDFTYHRKNVTVFAPFGTMIVVSIILTVVINIFTRIK